MEKYIPERAVRELIKKHAPYAALEPMVDAVIDDLEALLATAAPQDEAPEPKSVEALALEVRELARRYAEHLPAGFRASLGLLLSERGKPASEPEGLREAFERWAITNGQWNLARHPARISVYLDDSTHDAWTGWQACALARPAAAEGVESHINAITSAVRADEGYAISWHANIAMAFQDESGDHATANRAAARFMGQLFGVDTLPLVASDDGEQAHQPDAGEEKRA
jgi:hypothetical protein